MRRYATAYKKAIVESIKEEGLSTVGTARAEKIPLKTLEKWITAYNKDPHCFDPKPASLNDEIRELRQKIANLNRQKKVLKKQLDEKLLEKEELKKAKADNQ